MSHEQELANRKLKDVLDTLGVTDHVQPPPTVEEQPKQKTCKFCRSRIAFNAVKCPQCQEWFIERESKKRNYIAAFFSFLIPGLGQLVYRSPASGAYWFFGALLGYAMLFFPGLAVHIWSVVDASKCDS